MKGRHKLMVYWDAIPVAREYVPKTMLEIPAPLIMRCKPTPEALGHRWNSDMIRQLDGHMFVEATCITVEIGR